MQFQLEIIFRRNISPLNVDCTGKQKSPALWLGIFYFVKGADRGQKRQNYLLRAKDSEDSCASWRSRMIRLDTRKPSGVSRHRSLV